MARVDDMLQKMMRRFDASEEHTKELRSDLTSIGQKYDAHAISIKHLELQMTQLSLTVNPRQPGTIPVNTVQNLKNDGYCTTIITRGGKKTIDPPMPSGMENVIRGDDEQMPGYAKFMKDMVTKKIWVSFEDDDIMQHCSAIATRSLVQKKEDLGSFTILCTIGLLHFA